MLTALRKMATTTASALVKNDVGGGKAARAQWLAIDTDAGVDDAVAICLALLYKGSQQYTTKLITTQFGNTTHANVKTNVCKIRRACHLDSTTGPRICVGADGPVNGDPAIDAGYFHGKDGLGDATDIAQIDLDDGNHGLDSSANAVDAILALAVEAEAAQADLTLVTLGPLTNFANCLARDPSLTTRLRKTILMGGCGNARGNISIVAEFNVAADPEAAAAVFAAYAARDDGAAGGGAGGSGGELVIVPWELTLQYPLPWDRFDALLYPESGGGGGGGGAAGAGTEDGACGGGGCADTGSDGDGGGGPGAGARALLGSACRSVYVTQRADVKERRAAREKKQNEDGSSVLPPDGAVICDALAVAVALDSDNVLTGSQRVHVDVELTGTHTRGMTVVDWGASFTEKQVPNCTWVTAVSVESYAAALDNSIGRK